MAIPQGVETTELTATNGFGAHFGATSLTISAVPALGGELAAITHEATGFVYAKADAPITASGSTSASVRIPRVAGVWTSGAHEVKSWLVRVTVTAVVRGRTVTWIGYVSPTASVIDLNDYPSNVRYQAPALVRKVGSSSAQPGGPSSPPITVNLTANTTWGRAADLAGLDQNAAHLVRFQQDALGGHALTWGSGIVQQDLPLVSQVDGAETSVLLTYSPAAANWFAGHFRTYVPPDTVPPNPGVLAATSVTDTSISLRCSGASDLRELGTLPYEFSLDGGQTWGAPQQSQDYSRSGLTPGQTYPCRVRVSDSSGNTAEASVSVTMAAALIALDTFTRADTTSGLGVTETGALAWETPAGVWGVSQGRASVTTKSGATDLAVINIGRSTNFAVEVEVVSTPQVSFRYVDPANRFAFGAKDSSTLYLRRFVSGVGTTLGAEFAHATVTGDRFRVAVVGNVITCSVQSAGSSTWTQAVRVTDSALTGGTRVGMNRYGVAGAVASSIMVEPQ